MDLSLIYSECTFSSSTFSLKDRKPSKTDVHVSFKFIHGLGFINEDTKFWDWLFPMRN